MKQRLKNKFIKECLLLQGPHCCQKKCLEEEEDGSAQQLHDDCCTTQAAKTPVLQPPDSSLASASWLSSEDELQICSRWVQGDRTAFQLKQRFPIKLCSWLMELSNRFLARHTEKEELNQYWYSPATISVLVEELLTISQRAAFLSTPSLYFSLPKTSELRKGSALFDIDKQWSREPNFVLYDYNNPEDIPVNIHNTFDCVVIDPPFITEEVWTLYAAAAKLLLAPEGRIVLSTIPENDSILEMLLGVTPQKFKPSIPHLVYQYHIYTNYNSVLLSQPNPEIIADV